MDVDAYLNGRWERCASIELQDPAEGFRRGGVRVRYEADYAIEHLGARDHRAMTVRAPVDLGVRELPHWPSFLIDLLPQGAARRRIERAAGVALSDWELLKRGAVNPVGNLRIRPEAERVQPPVPAFDLREMVERGDAFVDHANELGSTVAGATDTQGEAPKFWVVQDMNGKWHPDSGALGFAARRYALLKFPLPEAGPRALDILRHEAAYQRVVRKLGLRVTADLPEFVDGALLIPRFDRRVEKNVEIRVGVESLYSIAGVLDSATTPLRHHDALIALSTCVSDFDAEMVEYVRRDLLNLALGNRDNHGRNTAVLKDTDGSVRLAPLYDLGPAFLDARAIARVIRWDGEQAGQRDWNLILENLAIRFEEAGVTTAAWIDVVNAMKRFAKEIDELPSIMKRAGVDATVIRARRDEMAQLRGELQRIRMR